MRLFGHHQQMCDHLTPIIFDAIIRAKLRYEIFSMKVDTTYNLLKFIWML